MMAYSTDLLVMMNLLFLISVTSAADLCECSSHHEPFSKIDGDHAMYLECCTGNLSKPVNITWYFKDKQQQTLRKSQHCTNNGYNGDQFLYLGRLTQAAQGNYTCVISAPDGTNVTQIQHLTVHNQTKCNRKPSFVKVEALDNTQSSSTDFAPLAFTNTKENETVVLHVYRGDNVTLRCSGHMCGVELDDHIYWRKYNLDHKGESIPNKDNHIHGEQKDDGRGTVFQILHIFMAKEEDFGIYTCFVENGFYGHNSRSVIITYKKPVLEIVLGLSVFLIGFLLVLGFLWWHCRIPWLLYYRNVSSGNRQGLDMAEFEYDVLIVHGESSTTWVYKVLVPKLEHLGFICYLPARDMEGGEDQMSAITSVVRQCLRVLVVVTPCVQDELSEKWALLQGFRVSLNTNTRIFAVILENITSSKSKTFKLNKMLDKITRIPVPLTLQMIRTSLGHVPVMCQESSLSDNSVPSLQNYNSGHVQVMRQESGLSENSIPSSPCSTTAFILPSVNCSTTTQLPVSGSLWTCMHIVCCGNAEERFWQQVRFELPPSPLSQTKIAMRQT